MSNVTNISAKKQITMRCQDCGHEFLRKDADPSRKHRCPRCKKYHAVVEYSQVAEEGLWKCVVCEGRHYALKEDGLQCYKCGTHLNPLDVWVHLWSSGYELQPRESTEEEA